MYRYIDMDPLVKDRMVAEYLDSCIQCTFSKKGFRTKDSYSVLLFSFLLVIVIVKSIRQIKSNRKRKTRKGNTSGLFVQKCWSGSQPTLPCKYYPTLCG